MLTCYNITVETLLKDYLKSIGFQFQNIEEIKKLKKGFFFEKTNLLNHSNSVIYSLGINNDKNIIEVIIEKKQSKLKIKNENKNELTKIERNIIIIKTELDTTKSYFLKVTI